MKKTEKKTKQELTLQRNTLRRIDPIQLERAVGGANCPCAYNGEWTSKVDA